MRIVPAAITAARQSAASTLCKIWRIERTDGVVLRFTEHDRDLVVDGETYVAGAYFNASAVASKSDLGIGDMDVEGAFDSAAITQEDILAGRYLGAAFVVAEVLWDAPEEGTDVLKFGWLGRVTERGGRYVAELLDPKVRLNKPLLRVHSPQCDAQLGDARCRVGLASFTQTGEVTVATGRRVFDAAGLSMPTGDFNWFDRGVITWTSGANSGLSMDVRASDGVTVELMLAMPLQVEVGDAFSIVAGCNKTLGQCISKFANVLNFRGKPHAPTSDDMIKGIDAAAAAQATPPTDADGGAAGADGWSTGNEVDNPDGGWA